MMEKNMYNNEEIWIQASCKAASAAQLSWHYLLMRKEIHITPLSPTKISKKIKNQCEKIGWNQSGMHICWLTMEVILDERAGEANDFFVQIHILDAGGQQFCIHKAVNSSDVIVNVSVLLRMCRHLRTYHFSITLSLTSTAPGSRWPSLRRMLGWLLLSASWHYFTRWELRRSVWPWTSFWWDGDFQRRVNYPSAWICIKWSGLCTENMLVNTNAQSVYISPIFKGRNW